MLPWPGENGLAADGLDYFNPEIWRTFYDSDRDEKRDTAWIPPQDGPLAAARETVAALSGAKLDPECCLYVAGRAPTPIAVRCEQGRVEIGSTSEGDGRVPWTTGIPAGVPVWYTDAMHGDLANHERAFEAYRELIETGNTRLLPRSAAGARGEAAPVFRPRGLDRQCALSERRRGAGRRHRRRPPGTADQRSKERRRWSSRSSMAVWPAPKPRC